MRLPFTSDEIPISENHENEYGVTTSKNCTCRAALNDRLEEGESKKEARIEWPMR
jgi:hypothetical protein